MQSEPFRGGLLALGLAAILVGAGAATAQEEKPAPPRAELERQARELNQRVAQLYGQGKLAEATQVARQALELSRRLYANQHYPDGHPDLAASLNNLGVLLRDRGEYARAEPLYQDALAM